MDLTPSDNANPLSTDFMPGEDDRDSCYEQDSGDEQSSNAEQASSDERVPNTFETGSIARFASYGVIDMELARISRATSE